MEFKKKNETMKDENCEEKINPNEAKSFRLFLDENALQAYI